MEIIMKIIYMNEASNSVGLLTIGIYCTTQTTEIGLYICNHM